MAWTPSRVAGTQFTASGTGSTLTLPAGPVRTMYLKHTNGTGTITAQATAVVEVRTNGGTLWYAVGGRTGFGFGTTASNVVDTPVDLPPDAVEARVTYTAPTGSTGHTLDYEVGTGSY